MSKPTEVADAIGIVIGVVLGDFCRMAREAKTPGELTELARAIVDEHRRALRTVPNTSARLQSVVLRGMAEGLASSLSHSSDCPAGPHTH